MRICIPRPETVGGIDRCDPGQRGPYSHPFLAIPLFLSFCAALLCVAFSFKSFFSSLHTSLASPSGSVMSHVMSCRSSRHFGASDSVIRATFWWRKKQNGMASYLECTRGSRYLPPTAGARTLASYFHSTEVASLLRTVWYGMVWFTCVIIRTYVLCVVHTAFVQSTGGANVGVRSSPFSLLPFSLGHRMGKDYLLTCSLAHLFTGPTGLTGLTGLIMTPRIQNGRGRISPILRLKTHVDMGLWVRYTVAHVEFPSVTNMP